MQEKCRAFIKDISTPIKKQHGDNIEKYLERFIGFPGAISVVSVIFTSSNLVKNQYLAITGMVLVISSLLVALNIFRRQINLDKNFYNSILDIEKPMTKFTRSLTVFSRENNVNNEERLTSDFISLQTSYSGGSSEKENEDAKKLQRIYSSINISFWLLVAGFILSLLSILFC